MKKLSGDIWSKLLFSKIWEVSCKYPWYFLVTLQGLFFVSTHKIKRQIQISNNNQNSNTKLLENMWLSVHTVYTKRFPFICRILTYRKQAVMLCSWQALKKIWTRFWLASASKRLLFFCSWNLKSNKFESLVAYLIRTF